MLTAVLIMSKILSTPNSNGNPATGILAASKTATTNREGPGTPS